MSPLTPTIAAERRMRLIRHLKSANNAQAFGLANLLARCTPQKRCHSAACFTCGIAFQRAAASAVQHFIGHRAETVRGRRTAITIIPASGCKRPDQLTSQDFCDVGSEIKVTFARLKLPSSIIGIEASFNEHRQGKFRPHWCVHGHCIQVDWISELQKEALKAIFRRSLLIHRPVFCARLDNNIEGHLYPFKPQRFRRVIDGRSSDPPRHRDLRPSQAANLAIAEHESGFRSRFLLHDIDEQAVWRHFEGFGWPQERLKRLNRFNEHINRFNGQLQTNRTQHP